MQLAVIDDLIQESKSQIEQSEPCTQLERITKLLECQVFVDCAFQAEFISRGRPMKILVSTDSNGFTEWVEQME